MTEQRQFVWYISYSCGVPLLLTFTIVILDIVESIPEPLQPGVGTNNCFLYREYNIHVHFQMIPIIY